MKRSLSKVMMCAFIMSLSPMVLAQSASQQTISVENRTLNIDGQMQGNAGYMAANSAVEEEVVTDKELDFIRSELKKQNKEIKLNKEKSKGFKQLQKSTEKLADATEEYLDEKLEAEEQISEYNKKIDCLLNNAAQEGCEKYLSRRQLEKRQQDEVEISQAAPVVEEVVAIEPQEVVTEVTEQEKSILRLIPFFGARSFTSDELSLETQYAGGVRVEGEIDQRVIMGVGLSLLRMDSQLIVNNVTGGNYNSFYSQGRELSYSNIALDFYGRYSLTQSKRFTPYVGAGVSYNRSKLSYMDNNSLANIGPEVYADESYINHFITGNLNIGADISISDKIGLNLQFDYSRGIGNSLTDEASKNPGSNADQQKLIDISNEIVSSNNLAVSLGMIVNF